MPHSTRKIQKLEVEVRPGKLNDGKSRASSEVSCRSTRGQPGIPWCNWSGGQAPRSGLYYN